MTYPMHDLVIKDCPEGESGPRLQAPENAIGDTGAMTGELKEAIRGRLGTHKRAFQSPPVQTFSSPFRTYETVHVEDFTDPPYSRPAQFREWFSKARVFPPDQPTVDRWMAKRKVDRSDFLGLIIRPRRSRARRLLFRAVRAYVDGKPKRAEELSEKATEVATLEHDYDLIGLIQGFFLDIWALGDEPGTVVHLWRSQARWWSGRKWPGGGKRMEGLIAVQKQWLADGCLKKEWEAYTAGMERNLEEWRRLEREAYERGAY